MTTIRPRALTAPTLALAAALLAAPTLRAQMPAQPPVPPPPSIVTSATGELEVTPDMATIQFGVETRGATAAEAGSRNARIQTAVLDTLRRLGYAKEDVGTLGYSVSPEYQYPKEGGTPKVVGYTARNTIRARARKIDLVGPTIDAALAKGATNVAGLRFESSQADSLRRQALRVAVQNARADAMAIADAAGGALGDLVEITNESGAQPLMEQPMMMARVAQADASTPIAPGQQKIAVTVNARWRFVAGAKR